MSNTIASLRQCMKITFPPVTLQLLEEAVKPTPDFEILARILGMDPVLTATVLTLANSPYYNAGQKVTDLNRAATILGTKEILKIALSISYQKHLGEAFKKHGIDFFANWRLIVWSAIAAELLAERLCPDLSDQAYLTALLKDISLLLMVCADPTGFKELGHHGVITAFVPGQLEAERGAWSADHCRLTADLLDELNISASDQACIAFHHDMDSLDAHSPLTQCIILATRWSELELGTSGNPASVLHFRTALQRRLDIGPEEMDELFIRCAQRFQSMLATLGIEEAPHDDRFYQHSIKLMQEYHFLASEIAQASDGRQEVAAIIGRHLRFIWDVRRWELALGVPKYNDWELFASQEGREPARLGTSGSRDALPWTAPKSHSFPIVTSGPFLGELRLPRQGLSQETLRLLGLYVRFVSQNYEHFALRQSVLEAKAHTLDQLPVGVARLSPSGAIQEINDRLRQFLGLPGDCLGRDLWTALGEGKDLSRDSQWDSFLADPGATSLHKIFCLYKGEHHDTDACVYLAAEKRQWQGRDEILLFLEDVTLVSGWEFKALKQGEFLEKLVKSMRDSVFTIDATGRITFASPRVAHLLEKNLFQLARPTSVHQGAWGPEMLAGAPAPVEALTPGAPGEQPHNLEFVFSPLPKTPGGQKQWLVVGRDITTVRRLEDKLKRLALFDGLTGLLNHYQFHVILEREAQRSKRTKRPMGVLFFDLDNFKAVNDTLGHQAGDDVLRAVSRILKARLRKGMDYPCRYGGDEFAVVVTEVEPAQLMHLAQRLHEAVSQHFEGRLGMSAGLAMLEAEETPSSLLRRADKASYTAKSQGGGCIVWSGEAPMP
ncbi:Diguanylate cyclase DosC [Fundidesulfovibrio magnetotacticus]|uniref:diguanylate cyclase n=1 Tax=Fundidesulfovibrio magnetotacticus TaxID=2730080 RepID=A0A6V8LPE5_9BACT|nr:diguanylate cyclase [Fundidesulfovibrio magnetotacticus]GFK92391.1 Diguanylate cyclase DosC [Fundidesulfovibrio magnetotacticus]